MFAKVMSIPDELMREWFELLTDRPAEEVTSLISANPMEAKKTLGRDIIGFYHGDQAATGAALEWKRRFSESQDPVDIPEVAIPASELPDGKIWVCKLLVLAGLAKGNNEARRHIEGGAVTIGPDRQKITDPTANILVTEGLVVRVGKRNIIRVRLSNVD